MFVLVLVGLLSTLWEHAPLIGVGVLVVASGWTRSWRLGAATAAFTVAALVGHQPLPAVVALAGALLIAAHDLHARRPGEWFPLLAVGVGVLVAFLVDDWRALPPVTWDENTAVAVSLISTAHTDWALGVVVAVVVASGLALWAWRARNLVVLATAAAYLTAAWYLEPAVSEPGMQFLSQEQFDTLVVTAVAPARPEMVLLAGAAVAFGLDHGWRRWVTLAVAGPLVTWWEHGLLIGATLLAGALLLGALDVHARRPGAWYPLLVVGVGLFLVAVPAYQQTGGGEFGWFAYTPLTEPDWSAHAPLTEPDWHMGWVGQEPEPPWVADPVLVFAPSAVVLAGAAVALVLRDRRTRTR